MTYVKPKSHSSLLGPLPRLRFVLIRPVNAAPARGRSQRLIAPEAQDKNRGKNQSPDSQVSNCQGYHWLQRLRVARRSQSCQISGNAETELAYQKEAHP